MNIEAVEAVLLLSTEKINFELAYFRGHLNAFMNARKSL